MGKSAGEKSDNGIDLLVTHVRKRDKNFFFITFLYTQFLIFDLIINNNKSGNRTKIMKQ